VADALERLVTAAPWGTFDLREGAGYGAFPGERSPFMSFGLPWGYRLLTVDEAVRGARTATRASASSRSTPE
jgi:hypothetical protein